MKIRQLLLVLILSLSPLYGIELKDILVSETPEELEIKQSKFLSIAEKDLLQYEQIVRRLDQAESSGGANVTEYRRLRAEFDAYLTRRLNLIRKIFLAFRKEFTRVVDFIEPVGTDRLPAFSGLIAVLDDSIDEAKMKGSKDKWRDLKDRVNALQTTLNKPGVRQAYLDKLVLSSTEASETVFEAKTRLLHRWLLEGRRTEARPWVLELEKTHAEKALCLALLSHYWLEEYNARRGLPNPQELLEKELAKKFGTGAVTVKVSGADDLQKAFLYYLEALNKGYPPELEIPGLLPAYWERIRDKFNKIHPYWVFPDHFPGYRDFMKELASACQAVVENVPFKKYVSPAYRLLSDMYTYWPSKAGPKIIDFQEIMRLNRIAGNKKL
ncbi:MAG TPA: hypothetical protein PKO06_16545 [Candidatus Ozemobacteraceae bacterium]|nr:hypothetical protein [Candidatus Ozemobacteraceae bacterium]